MFDPSDSPRMFGLAPGIDFARGFVAGLLTRTDDLAQARIYVNSARMQRQVRAEFDAGPPRLLPRIKLVTDLAFEGDLSTLDVPVSPLRRRLELSRAVEKLIDATPGLPRAALYDLSDSLAALMDEMHGEGVDFDTLAHLDISDVSGHWQQSLAFLKLLEPYFIADAAQPDAAARQRRHILSLIDTWATTPPDTPVIVAGSTGSRGATGLLMQAVARLPQGAVVLPGFDFDLPQDVWDGMATGMTHEDHPQYRYRRLMHDLDMTAAQVFPWTIDAPPTPARNALVSLSLRPAPVTDQWRTAGRSLTNLPDAMAQVTLVEADSPRGEAETIALRLRQAAAEGTTAALITPDRMLTRQVAAALDRWDIIPDDSAGLPLGLSPPGRFLEHIVSAFGRPVTAEALLVLLKHPLTNNGADRNQHLLWTRDLELHLRQGGPPFLTADVIATWIGNMKTPKYGLAGWTAWVGGVIAALDHSGTLPIADHLAQHMAAATLLATGPNGTDTGELFQKQAGRKARGVVDALARDADAGNPMDTRDYAALFRALLAKGSVRDRDAGRPDILILGTLEARVGGAELVILGGMNDGIWPPSPTPDPWLNRPLRAQAGLLLPERQIGLSAHDYQQAVCAPHVWITRARRDADAETVPSRWVNRLTNLLAGLPDGDGPTALQNMRNRGNDWLRQAARLSQPDAPVARALRPAPQPPVTARPSKISVTQIKTLYRDPYAIYARKVLKLNALNPLTADVDAALKGDVFHKILERFVDTRQPAADPTALHRLLTLADQTLAEMCPWPTVRLQWRVLMDQIAPQFLHHETARQTAGTPIATETWGDIVVPGPNLQLNGKADRIDAAPDGRALIYDYKTGRLPSVKEQGLFDKQLLVEAAMIERGAFAAVGARPVQAAEFLGIKRGMPTVRAPLDDHPPDVVWSQLIKFLTMCQAADWPYTARRAPQRVTYDSEYDHLARRGEWTDADKSVPQVLT
ncbi:double-strand break repair protein AddB [Loktanella sp. SALINAS62]|uniref:double-strand break repair protein AddB n=1 Tax=Loktanella sp. SALINAS62 TaxID=2706124 RepID=UPI001B8AA95E|nr:double-strand break repair protein AddB [Loktanella sp. SALINAS62]MBS1302431.1 double-strand break repair protein AddB [Loktanella sp. SALINAS62]